MDLCKVFILIILFINLENAFSNESPYDRIIEGNNQLVSGKYKQSVGTFLDVLRANPDNYLALYGLGASYEKLSMIDSAIFYLNKAVFYKKDLILAFYRLGVIKYNSGYFTNALRDFEKVIESNPEHLEAILYSALCFEKMGLMSSASQNYKKLASLTFSKREFLLKSIKLHIHFKSHAATIEDFDKLISEYPDYDSAYYYRGLCKLYNYMPEQAVNDFSRAISIKNDFIEAYIFRARAKELSKIKDVSSINDDLNIWKRINPGYLDGIIDKAYTSYYENSFYDALTNFNIALAADSSRKELLFSIALCHYGNKNYNSSLQITKEILNKEPVHEDAFLLKVKNCFELYKEARAIASNKQTSITIYLDADKLNSSNSVSYLMQVFDEMKQRMNIPQVVDVSTLYDSLLVAALELEKSVSGRYETFLLLGEIYLLTHDFLKASLKFDKAVEFIDDPECYYKRGLFLMKQRKYSEALKDFTKAYNMNYNTLDIKVIISLLNDYTHVEDLNSAQIRLIFDDEMQRAMAHFKYGLFLYEYINNHYDAIKYFNKAIEYDPYLYDAYYYKKLIFNKASKDEQNRIIIK